MLHEVPSEPRGMIKKRSRNLPKLTSSRVEMALLTDSTPFNQDPVIGIKTHPPGAVGNSH